MHTATPHVQRVQQARAERDQLWNLYTSMEARLTAARRPGSECSEHHVRALAAETTAAYHEWRDADEHFTTLTQAPR